MPDRDVSLPLAEGVVDLWFCLPKAVSAAGLEGRCLEIIGSEERSHYEQLKLNDHRLEYLVSHAFLRVVLSCYSSLAPMEWLFRRNDYGKPQVENDGCEQLRFNLSHTAGMSLCAVTRGADLGVDVEYHANSQGLLEVADHYFSDREIADLQALPSSVQEQLFFRYWTLKEAYIKARGEGLTIPLDSFSFRLLQDEKVVFEPPEVSGDTGRWHFRWWNPSEHYTASLAINGALHAVNLFESTLDGHRRLQEAQDLFADL